jgi:hypothetical protein
MSLRLVSWSCLLVILSKRRAGAAPVVPRKPLVLAVLRPAPPRLASPRLASPRLASCLASLRPAFACPGSALRRTAVTKDAATVNLAYAAYAVFYFQEKQGPRLAETVGMLECKFASIM